MCMVIKMQEICIENARVYVSLYRTGNKRIWIHNLSKTELEKVAELTDTRITEDDGDRWVNLQKARDKSKVTFFEGGEK